MALFGPNIARMKQRGDIAGLEQLLKSDDTHARHDAIVALGELRAASALPALLEILLTPNAKIGELIAAAEALGNIGDNAAVEGLLKASAISRERERTQINATALERDPAYRHGLYINLISTEEFSFRRAVAAALGKIGGTRASAALYDMLAAETGPMEGSAQAAIRSAMSQALTGSSKFEILRAALEHPAPAVREWAVENMREVDDPRVQEYLMAMMWDDKQPFAVRQVAISTLGQIGDQRAMEELEELSKSPLRVLARDAQHSAAIIYQRLQTSRGP